MLQLKKSWSAVLAVIVLASGAWLSQWNTASADGVDKGIACVMEVVVVSKNQSGTVIGTESYLKEFVLTEDGRFDDDFSTRTRFKFFSASLEKVDGESTITVNWSADVTVFNAVDFNTSVTLEGGQKRGSAAGDHTFYNSSGSTKTTFSLKCVEE
jgi:hypothetical protein